MFASGRAHTLACSRGKESEMSCILALLSEMVCAQQHRTDRWCVCTYTHSMVCMGIWKSIFVRAVLPQFLCDFTLALRETRLWCVQQSRENRNIRTYPDLYNENTCDIIVSDFWTIDYCSQPTLHGIFGLVELIARGFIYMHIRSL